MENFVDETTIHGIKHAAKGHNYAIKFLWLIIVGCLFILLILGIFLIVAKFLRYERNADISIEDIRAFPSFSVCPSYWVDDNAAKHLGIDEKLLQYVLGFTGVLPHDTDIKALPEPIPYSLEQMDELKGRFINLAENFTTLSKLLKNISVSEKKFFAIPTCSGCAKLVAVQKVIKSFGVCYLFVIDKTPPASLKLKLLYKPNQEMELLVKIKKEYRPKEFFQILVGPLAAYETQENSVILRSKFSYDIFMQPMIYRRSENCEIAQQGIYQTCEQRCLIQYQKQHGKNAKYFMGEKFDTRNAKYIHSGDESWVDVATDYISLSLKACGNLSCPVLCEYTKFELNLVSYPEKVTGTPTQIEINFRLPGTGKAILFRSTETYTWSLMVADIGGILNLFLGASLISLIHLVIYGFTIPCRKSGKVAESTENNIRELPRINIQPANPTVNGGPVLQPEGHRPDLPLAEVEDE